MATDSDVEIDNVDVIATIDFFEDGLDAGEVCEL